MGFERWPHATHHSCSLSDSVSHEVGKGSALARVRAEFLAHSPDGHVLPSAPTFYPRFSSSSFSNFIKLFSLVDDFRRCAHHWYLK